jgi:hypothetical protein
MSKISPEHYVAPVAPKPPTELELKPTKDAMTARVKAIVNASAAPIPYYDVVMKLKSEGFNSSYIDPMKLVEDVDKLWHPEKFEPTQTPFPVPPKGEGEGEVIKP